MANGLMGLSNLLGQSSNAQSGGLIGGGIFSQPEGRGQRRSRLLTEAISGAGSDPYARLGAAFGGLIGMGGRAAAEGLGIVNEPPEVKRANAIRQVQEEVRQTGLDPMSNPAEFGELVTNRFQELGYPDLALRTQMQIRQMMPEAQTTSRVVRGGTEEGTAIGLGQGESAVVEYKGDRPVDISDREIPDQAEGFVPLTEQQKINLGIDPNKFAQQNRVTGRVHTSGGQTINVGGEPDPAYEALTDQFKSDLERASESASQATGLLQEVDRATTILSDPDFNTGAARPVLTNLRALAEDLGVSVDPALEAAGVEDLGQVSGAESFRAFSANLTTRLAERLPGNLNQQEINLISTASSNLGKTPEANAEALASFRAGAELAQQRASSLTRAASQGTDAFIEEQKRQREVGIDRFRRLTERYKQRILEERGRQSQPDPAEPTGTVDWSEM